MNHKTELIEIIKEKQTILLLSLDVTNKNDFFSIIKKCAPYICGIKLHLELYSFLNKWNLKKLLRLAKKYRFILIEDRKFSDIGNTQYLQAKQIMKKGIYYFTSHLFTGEKALQSFPEEANIFLVTDMSCEGAFLSNVIDLQPIIHKSAVEYYTHNPRIIGFVSQHNIKTNTNDMPIILRPGVRLSSVKSTDDSKGQIYKYPTIEPGVCWVVGREIYNDSNPELIVKQYQKLFKRNKWNWNLNSNIFDYKLISSV